MDGDRLEGVFGDEEAGCVCGGQIGDDLVGLRDVVCMDGDEVKVGGGHGREGLIGIVGGGWLFGWIVTVGIVIVKTGSRIADRTSS